MRLYDYQEKYLEGLPSSCIMAADLGTGKTLMSLAHWDRQMTGNRLLIVAPASKIRTEDWENEAQRYFTNMGVRKNYDYDGVVEYISYESLRLMDKETRRPRHWKFTGARNGGIVYDVIADECHALKNPQSKQSKAIYEIVRSGGLFIGLTGTPLPNGWIDFAGYSKIFGFTKGITEFKKKYCRIQDFKGFPEIIGYNNTEELDEQFKSVAKKLSREDARELPSRQMIACHIEMNKKISRRYYELKITRQDNKTGEILDNNTRLLSVLRQTTTDGRLDKLMSIVDDTSDNIVIFYNYISERQAILKALSKTDKHILRYDGDVHDKLPASDANISNTVLLAHYKSASTGLNLQWANVTIYFSPTYSYQEFEQSIGRTHRNGQTKKCLYYLFNVKNTVDRDIWDCLREKRDFSEKLWINKTIDKL
jgi:SNF2 family DNA or RNA helicase